MPPSDPDAAPAVLAPLGGPRLRVLVSAFATSPIGGSEPGLGWNIVSRLARWHDVTVLCTPGMPGERNFRQEIDTALRRSGPIPGLTLRYVPPPPLSRLLQSEGILRRRTVYYAGYRSWQQAAYKMALALHREAPFDLTHHLSMTGYREPGFLWKLSIPFVWGPIEGGENIPSDYLCLMGGWEKAFYVLRNMINDLQKAHHRRARAAAHAARHIWAVGGHNAEMVRRCWGRGAELVVENGAQAPCGSPRSYDRSRPLRLVWVGKHIGRKALPILLHALARMEGPAPCEMVVIGEGPQTEAWTKLAVRLGVAERIRWTGSIPHDAVLAEIRDADALAHTSLIEGTSAVILEALASGAPVLCHDTGGMGVAVTPGCGIKVPLNDVSTSIAGFQAALERLHREPGLVGRLSAGALARAQELSWDTLARRIAERYGQVVATAPRG